MNLNRNNRGDVNLFETLEERKCFADVSYIGGLTQQLTITGSDTVDNITIISFPGGSSKFRVLSGGSQIWQGDSGLVDNVVIDLKGGNDILQMTSEAANIYQDDKVWDLKLGTGNNIARLDYASTLFHKIGGIGDWSINLTSGLNTDDVTVNMGRRLSGSTTLDIDLGSGSDFYTGGIAGNTDDGLTRISVNGGSGNDSLVGGVGPDYLYGANDNDTIRGGAGNDTLLGGAQTDQLFGEEGNDWLDGSANNYIDGAHDTLFGGAGNDTFVQYNLSEDALSDRLFTETVINKGGIVIGPPRR